MEVFALTQAVGGELPMPQAFDVAPAWLYGEDVLQIGSEAAHTAGKIGREADLDDGRRDRQVIDEMGLRLDLRLLVEQVIYLAVHKVGVNETDRHLRVTRVAAISPYAIGVYALSLNVLLSRPER